MAEPRVWAVVGPIFNVEMGVSCKPGDLIYYSGANDDWRLADADSNATYAQAIVCAVPNVVADGIVVSACKECYLVDSDSGPFSEDTQLYLSTTAGGYTETRPTGADDLRQVVGHSVAQAAAEFGTVDADKTHMAHLHIKDPYEVHQWVPIYVGIGANEATSSSQLDSGNFIGYFLDAQNEVVGAAGMVPENMIGTAPKIAYLCLAAEATAGTPTFDLFVSAGNDAEQWDVNTQDTGIADSAAEGAAADELQKTDVTAAFDSNMEPGRMWGARILKDDAGTDITLFFGFYLVWECV